MVLKLITFLMCEYNYLFLSFDYFIFNIIIKKKLVV